MPIGALKTPSPDMCAPEATTTAQAAQNDSNEQATTGTTQRKRTHTTAFNSDRTTSRQDAASKSSPVQVSSLADLFKSASIPRIPTPEDREKKQAILDDADLGVTAKAMALLILQVQPGQIARFEDIVAIIHYLNGASCGHLDLDSYSEKELRPPPPQHLQDTYCSHEAIRNGIFMDGKAVGTAKHGVLLHRFVRAFHVRWPDSRRSWKEMRDGYGYGAIARHEAMSTSDPEHPQLRTVGEFALDALKDLRLHSSHSQQLARIRFHQLNRDQAGYRLKGVSDRYYTRMYNMSLAFSDKARD